MEHETSVFPPHLEIREYCFLILRNSELRKITFFSTLNRTRRRHRRRRRLAAGVWGNSIL